MGPNGPGTVGKAQYVKAWGENDEMGVLPDRSRGSQRQSLKELQELLPSILFRCFEVDRDVPGVCDHMMRRCSRTRCSTIWPVCRYRGIVRPVQTHLLHPCT